MNAAARKKDDRAHPPTIMSKVITELYDNYKIMPQLAMHQLRVAAVAYAIEQALFEPLHEEELISACLLHDMGNILKFDFAVFPEYLEPQGRAYWEEVREAWKKRYGTDEHAATLAIAREIGVSGRTMEYIDAVGFSKAAAAARGDSFEKKIACYADQRVAPQGVVSLDERLEEGFRRYAGREDRKEDDEAIAANAAALKEIERQIFSRASDTAESITPTLCEHHVAALKKYHVV